MNEISNDLIAGLVEANDISTLSLPALERLVRNNRSIQNALPDGRYSVDPRNGDIVLFVSSRAKRPQDTLPLNKPDTAPVSSCPICQGKTTGIIDTAALSRGQTFINKNLYPVFYPFTENEMAELENAHAARRGAGGAVRGMHFLQWTSSVHNVDWHNMPLADREVVMRRMAILERALLGSGAEHKWRFVIITKNYGHLVGSSLAHGHQQIALSSVMPRRFADNLRFADWQGEKFSPYVLRENPHDLVINDYGPAVLLVPYFMRRPFDMLLVLKDSSKQYLHQLSEAELSAVASAWGDAIRAIMQVLPRRGRECAYNVVTNNGPGAGLYFEFLPYTQEIGGFEHIGLVTCEGEPGEVARELRKQIKIN